jgi:hypothetical protein
MEVLLALGAIFIVVVVLSAVRWGWFNRSPPPSDGDQRPRQ